VGHLSNETGGKLAAWCAQNGTGRVVLAHLSKENNTPALALLAAEKAMKEAGVRVGADVTLTVAPRSEGSGWMEVPGC
jgi:phosphoribosyl 1,2-cyclic phosphodiesterase